MTPTTPQLDPVDEPAAVLVGDPVGEPVDGRTARALRTRDSLVDATIALVEEGDLRPTAPRIAERAGVSVRSVFQHFDDLESLFSSVGTRVVEQILPLITPIDGALPLADRAARLVVQRCRVNEAITPINRAAILFAPTSATITRQFNDGHQFSSAHVTEVFAAELDRAGPGRSGLHDSLVIALSWTTWNLLRTFEDRSVVEATEAVARMVDLVLVGAGSKSDLS